MKTIYMFKTILENNGEYNGRYSAGLSCYQCNRTLVKDNFDVWHFSYENDSKIFKQLQKKVTFTRCPHCGQYLNADSDFDKF